MQEIRIAFQPKQLIFMKSIEDFPVTLYGGARGGGKSYSLRNIMLLRRFQYAGSHGVIFRKSFPELESNHIRPLFKERPYLKQYWNETKRLLSLPNGSTLQFLYCESEKDLENHQGQEYHDLGIDEAGAWSEQMFRTLHGSNRSSDPRIKPRCFMTANPGGIGHAWLKRIFVERKFKPNERAADYNFIQALVYDNAALMAADPDYISRLQAETNPALRRAYLEGDWDIMAGAYFDEIRRDVHFIPYFAPPKHWRKFGAYDFGFTHPATFGWFAVDEDGNVYLYREFVKAKLRVDQYAKELKKFPDTTDLYPIVGGRDCWTTKGVIREDNPPTIADEFKSHGIILKPAVVDRIQGANQVRKYLAWQDKPNLKPKFFIMDNCPITFECLSRMIVDPDRPEDVLKVDSLNGETDSGDDPYDMVRYGLMSRPLLTEALPDKHPYGSEPWAKQQVTQMEQAAEEHFKAQEDMIAGEDWDKWV